LTSGSGGGGAWRMGWPVNGRVTSGWGQRGAAFHHGLDIAAPTGTAIRAAYPGVVERAGWNGGYGYYTRIGHGRLGRALITTAYAHQSRIIVRQGQRVNAGAVIGYVGSTGDSTGPHLHFEVRASGRSTNPMEWLNGRYSNAPSAPPVQVPVSQPPVDWSGHVAASANAIAALFNGFAGATARVHAIGRSPYPR
jgi:murein DD-endopeptidase MepM/ murein hydrolase activator NlpD